MIFMDQQPVVSEGLGYIEAENMPQFPLVHTPNGQTTLLGAFSDVMTSRTTLIIGGLLAAAGVLYFTTRDKPRRRRAR